MKSENRQILLTPAGAGAIAVIRLIGPGVGDFLREHFSRPVPVPPVPSPAEPAATDSAGEGTGGTSSRCVHGDLRDGENVIDDVVVVVGEGMAGVTIFPGKADVPEYRRHGLEARATKNSQPDALPGIMVAPGMADICTHGGPWVVHCVADLAARAGFALSDDPLDGVDGGTIIEKEIAAALPLAKTELAIDALLAQRDAWPRITPADLPRMLADDSLMHLLHPPRVAIIGIPNVGKSTLANQLFAQERSITADLPGTTRDWVGELANIDGLPVVLVDTPGLRPSDDPIEQQAIQRSQPVIAAAELVILVLDPTQPRAAQDRLCEEYPAALRVQNKTDHPAMWQWSNPATTPLRIVATTGAGVDELRRAIQRHFHCEAYDPSRPRCWTERHQQEIRSRIAHS